MKSNPITALSNLFSKFVIEHGSAVVQEKHIALLKEQFSILERENTKLTAEKAELQSKNKILETENKALKDENIDLKKKIEEYQTSIHKKLPLKKEYICPRCHEPSFQLIQNLPHPNKFLANSGVTVRLHRCSKCNYEETI